MKVNGKVSYPEMNKLYYHINRRLTVRQMGKKILVQKLIPFHELATFRFSVIERTFMLLELIRTI